MYRNQKRIHNSMFFRVAEKVMVVSLYFRLGNDGKRYVISF